MRDRLAALALPREPLTPPPLEERPAARRLLALMRRGDPRADLNAGEARYLENVRRRLAARRLERRERAEAREARRARRERRPA